MEPFILVSSRYQPLHIGHLLFLEKIADNYKNKIILCPLMQPKYMHSNEEKKNTIADNYNRMIGWTYSYKNNPLPDNEKISLLKEAIRKNEKLCHRIVGIIIRKHPIENWENSLIGLPDSRVWAINYSKSDFDSLKITYYISKNEDIMCLSCGDYGYKGDEIRKALANGNHDLTFLPQYLRIHFEKYCLKYFKYLE